MSTKPDFVSETSLDWAKTHLSKFGDTDVFPLPFEYDAISANWTGVKKRLIESDLSSPQQHSPSQTLIAVPKPVGGFRICSLLDPIYNLLMTAVVHEAANDIEAYRVPKESDVVFSHRVDVQPSGDLFDRFLNWKAYHNISVEKATSSKCKYVLIFDIADCYNQIGLHRLNNALQSASISPTRATNIEKLIGRLNAKQSRGVPVGGNWSRLLAELSLHDIDAYLLQKRIDHVRYVDDFRVFCKTYKEAVEALHDITKYLYTAHRMCLQSSKTRILKAKTFLAKEAEDPEERENTEHQQKLRSLLETLDFGDYDADFDEDDLEKWSADLKRDNLRELLKLCLKKERVNLNLTKHVLRRARKLRLAALHDLVFQNLDLLGPVMREVVLYLSATRTRIDREKHGKQFQKFLEDGYFGGLPYTRLWCAELVLQVPDLVSQDDAWSIVTGLPIFSLRYQALLARKFNRVEWVREQKETWQNNGPWEKRAILYGGSILPADERKFWLEMAEEGADILEQSVAYLAKSGVTEY